MFIQGLQHSQGVSSPPSSIPFSDTALEDLFAINTIYQKRRTLPSAPAPSLMFAINTMYQKGGWRTLPFVPSLRPWRALATDGPRLSRDGCGASTSSEASLLRLHYADTVSLCLGDMYCFQLQFCVHMIRRGNLIAVKNIHDATSSQRQEDIQTEKI